MSQNRPNENHPDDPCLYVGLSFKKVTRDELLEQIGRTLDDLRRDQDITLLDRSESLAHLAKAFADLDRANVDRALASAATYTGPNGTAINGDLKRVADAIMRHLTASAAGAGKAGV